MPWPTTRSGESPPMRRPSMTIEPPSGGYMPEMALKSVVLPAPLGPIRAWSRRSARVRSTVSTAVKSPKRLLTPRQSRRGPTAGAAPWRKSGTSAPGLGVRRAAMAAASSSRRRKGRSSRSPRPINPEGEKRMKAMNMSPNQNCHEAVCSESSSRNRMKKALPSAGPRKCPMPPTMVMATISPEKATWTWSADANTLRKVKRQPPRPVTAAESVKAINL